MRVKLKIGKNYEDDEQQYIAYCQALDLLVTDDSETAVIEKMKQEAKHIVEFLEKQESKTIKDLAKVRYEVRLNLHAMLKTVRYIDL